MPATRRILLALVAAAASGDTLRITWVDSYGNDTTTVVRLSSGPPR